MSAQDSARAQQKGNRRIALLLGLIAAGVFASFLLRQWLSNH